MVCESILRALATESAHRVTGVASFILLTDIGDQRLRTLHLNLEGGDQRVFRVNDNVSRFPLNFKANRKLHLCALPLSAKDSTIQLRGVKSKLLSCCRHLRLSGIDVACDRAVAGTKCIVSKRLGSPRSQVVGNVGMYFAAYRLSQMGWNVMPTSRNARGIDLLAYDMTGGRYLGIQVKALSKRNPVPLGISSDNFMGDWWIIVTKIAADKPECFIMKPDEVRRLAHRGEKDGRVSYWLQPSQYDTDDFSEAWGRIGRRDVPGTEVSGSG